jgi:hypothetical protein
MGIVAYMGIVCVTYPEAIYYDIISSFEGFRVVPFFGYSFDFV